MSIAANAGHFHPFVSLRVTAIVDKRYGVCMFTAAEAVQFSLSKPVRWQGQRAARRRYVPTICPSIFMPPASSKGTT